MTGPGTRIVFASVPNESAPANTFSEELSKEER